MKVGGPCECHLLEVGPQNLALLKSAGPLNVAPVNSAWLNLASPKSVLPPNIASPNLASPPEPCCPEVRVGEPCSGEVGVLGERRRKKVSV